MGISRYNTEGYSDPTAYEAVKNLETFRITHPTGYIDLNIEHFFPCTEEKGRKVFRLIHEHCSEQQKTALLTALLRKQVHYAREYDECNRKLNGNGMTDKEINSIYARLKNAECLHKRISRNIEQLSRRETR